MRSKTTLMTVILFCISIAHSQILPKKNFKLPKLEVSSWITDKVKYKKKIVYLEFFETWSHHSISTIEHVNSLVEKFGEEIVFIGISTEDKKIIEEFLENNDLKLNMAIDKERKTITSFGVKGIPHAFLIDQRWKLAWHGHPLELTQEHLDEYLNTGTAPDIIYKGSTRERPQDDPVRVFEVSVKRPSGKKGMQSRKSRTNFTAELNDINLIGAIKTILSNHDPYWTVFEGNFDSSRYDFTVNYPIKNLYDNEYPFKILSILQEFFNFDMFKDKREMEVYSITCIDTAKINSKKFGALSNKRYFVIIHLFQAG